MADPTRTRTRLGGSSGIEALAARIAGNVAADGAVEPQRGLHLYRRSAPTEPIHGLYPQSLCVVAQGAKEVQLGGERYRYDPANYLLVSVGLPVTSRVALASRARPYLGLSLDLEPALVASVMVEAGVPAPRTEPAARAMNVNRLDPELRDALVRLVELLASPGDYRVLGPLVTREIIYRLLRGDQGPRLRQLAAFSGQTLRIEQAVERLRQDFAKPLRIGALARDVGMSSSTFHHQFKAVTAMSPLQFQKQLRLQEARRLLLGGDLDAASAGFRVGYEDASHFNRDYKRLFGAPPRQDALRLREGSAARVDA